MAWFRSKRMPRAALPDFRAQFDALFADTANDPGLALRVTDDPDADHVVVTIPFLRSGLVERVSPGGWYDRRQMPTTMTTG
ncbi:hypothetical protein FHS91_002112 [Sphingobium xanthum]|jgi:hypothetical protein